MRKTRGLFKKIRDNKGKFHAKMGSIKDRNGMELKAAEGIKKRWQEYTEKLYKKDLYDSDNHDGVITHTHLEPDSLECEGNGALGSMTMNKASGGDKIPDELFQILIDDMKVLHSMLAHLENSAVATGLEKVSFHSNPKKGNARECSNYRTIALISHASKVMLKILQGWLQQYVNRELPDVQAGFTKGIAVAINYKLMLAMGTCHLPLQGLSDRCCCSC